MSKRLHIRIGRGSKNHVVIEEEGVAEEHLELFADADGNVFISDLGSPFGTYVNGTPLKGYVLLSEEDKVTLGKNVVFNWKKFKSVPENKIDQVKPPIPQNVNVPKPSVHSKPLTPSPGLSRKKTTHTDTNKESTEPQGTSKNKKSKNKGVLHAPWYHILLIYCLIALFSFLIYITN